MVDTILLPTDGSEHAQRAAAHAIAVAKQEEATLEVVFVVDTQELGEPALSSVEIIIGEYEDRGREVLEGIAEAAEKRGVPVETRCCHGVPEEEITELADEVGADLIFVGKRGMTHEYGEGDVTRTLRREDDRVIVA